jgi:hypothetical protein
MLPTPDSEKEPVNALVLKPPSRGGPSGTPVLVSKRTTRPSSRASPTRVESGLKANSPRFQVVFSTTSVSGDGSVGVPAPRKADGGEQQGEVCADHLEFLRAALRLPDVEPPREEVVHAQGPRAVEGEPEEEEQEDEGGDVGGAGVAIHTWRF